MYIVSCFPLHFMYIAEIWITFSDSVLLNTFNKKGRGQVQFLFQENCPLVIVADSMAKKTQTFHQKVKFFTKEKTLLERKNSHDICHFNIFNFPLKCFVKRVSAMYIYTRAISLFPKRKENILR